MGGVSRRMPCQFANQLLMSTGQKMVPLGPHIELASGGTVAPTEGT